MDRAHHEMRFDVSFRVMRVDRATGLETGVMDGIIAGGTIERNQDTAIGEQASLDLHGTPPTGPDLIRVVADLSWPDGQAESVTLGTFLPDGPKREVDGPGASTPLTCYGRLRELQDSQFDGPYTVPAGDNPIDHVDAIVRDAGLTLLQHEDCTYRMGSAWTFGADDTESDGGESKLDAINDLLDLAGWSSAATDPYGRVILAPYVAPADKSPVWEFTEGEQARFLKAMTDEKDWFSTANHVRAVYRDTEREIIGIAVDDSPDSEFSTVNRGRTISSTTTFDDIPEDMSDEELQDMADRKAQELLDSAQAVIRRITMTHIYAPVTVGDVIHIDYPTGDVTGDYAIRTQKITLTAGLPIETEARAYHR